MRLICGASAAQQRLPAAAHTCFALAPRVRGLVSGTLVVAPGDDMASAPPALSDSEINPVVDELTRRGLLAHFERLFDEEDLPRDLPPAFAVAPVPAAVADWLRLLPPPRLEPLLRHEYMGKPRLPLSAAECEADFDILPGASSEQLAAEVAAAAAATVAETELVVVPPVAKARLLRLRVGTRGDAAAHVDVAAPAPLGS